MNRRHVPARPLALEAWCVHSSRRRDGVFVAGFEGASAGSAFGPPSILETAISEYVERLHFSRFSSLAGTLPLAQMDPGRVVLENLYRQLRSGPEVDVPNALPACWVLRWQDWQPVLIPRNLVAVGAALTVQERRLHPSGDSSAMSAHRWDDQSVIQALLEFVERQTVVAWWLGGGRACQLDRSASGIEPDCQSSGRESVALLLNAGLGGYTVLYASMDSEGAAYGAACRLDPLEAVVKAKQEAAHFRAFLSEKRAALARGEVHNRFERASLAHSCGSWAAPVRRALGSARSKSRVDPRGLPKVSVAQIRRRLLAVSPHLYVYLAQGDGLFGRHSFARLISPDFYAHADPGVPLNFNNALAVRLGIDQPPPEARTSTCLP